MTIEKKLIDFIKERGPFEDTFHGIACMFCECIEGEAHKLKCLWIELIAATFNAIEPPDVCSQCNDTGFTATLNEYGDYDEDNCNNPIHI